jgi:hypothetical protein
LDATERDGSIAEGKKETQFAASQPGIHGAGSEADVQPAIRKNFADTALWVASL